MTTALEAVTEPPVAADLAAVEVFRSLPDEAIADLVARSRVRCFGAGELVFDEGDLGDALFVVREGLLKVVRSTRGHGLALDRLSPGRAFGELAESVTVWTLPVGGDGRPREAESAAVVEA